MRCSTILVILGEQYLLYVTCAPPTSFCMQSVPWSPVVGTKLHWTVGRPGNEPIECQAILVGYPVRAITVMCHLCTSNNKLLSWVRGYTKLYSGIICGPVGKRLTVNWWHWKPWCVANILLYSVTPLSLYAGKIRTLLRVSGSSENTTGYGRFNN